MKQGEETAGGIVKAMGLVFGDIGTSPIYTLSVIMTLTRPTPEHIHGILSLIIWTLTILVSVEYAWLAMSLSRNGEGGTIVLKEILVRMIRTGRPIGFVVFLSYLGISLLLGDGVITPAISILSAVEGATLIPGFDQAPQDLLIVFAAIIAVGLFIFQYRGTDRVAAFFGPIMVVWFAALSVSGLVAIAETPSVVSSLSPHHALNFLRGNGIQGFLILSEVILCATGGEALYADMGHLGKRPIIRAWYLVFIALVINYLGQGAFILRHPEAKNILFGMVRWEAPALYIPFLILTITATVIASQALISGVFSIVYQGITTRIMPLLRIQYTSTHLKSQIYIGAVNWSLLVMVIFIMVLFRRSENLAAAYGLAVTGSMTITGLMMTMIYARTTRTWKVPVAMFVTVVDIIFLAANFTKLPHGGYWSLILAALPLVTILIWTSGQRTLYRSLRPLDIETFLISYGQIYGKGKNIPGTALFFTREWEIVPPYVVHCIIKSGIIYERNIFVSVSRTDEPYGIYTCLTRDRAPGLDSLEIRAGYMAVLDIEAVLQENGIREKVIFYGVEEIATTNPVWKVFTFIKRNTPTFVQFNKLPSGKLQGVVTRVEM